MGKAGRPLGGAVVLPGPAGLAAAVIRQAFEDHQAGNLGAGLWLASEHGLTWARAAGLDGDYDWREVLRVRGLAIDGAYAIELDADMPETGDNKTYKAILRFRASGESRLVVSALVTACAACGGDLPAAVRDLAGTAAGERLRAWLTGE